MKLNLGCGEFYAVGWMNVDSYFGGQVQPDVVASLLDLPFPDDSAEVAYCGHVLEHIAAEDLPRALAEVGRVLAPDGELMVVGPDLDRARVAFPDAVSGIERGGHRWPGDEHRWISTEAATLAVLRETGFDAEPLDIAAVPDTWPVVSRAGWQFAIEARHRTEGAHG